MPLYYDDEKLTEMKADLEKLCLERGITDDAEREKLARELLGEHRVLSPDELAKAIALL